MARKPPQKRSWVITTSDERPLADIAKDLRKAGFKIDHTLTEIGVITGNSDDQAVSKARAIKGVTDISPQPIADIGPPNSRDTW